MDVTRIRATEVPGGRRLSAEVRYRVGGSAEEVWFAVPEEIAEVVDPDSGNLWLVLFLPLAATLGETLRVERPVHPAVLASAREVLRIWRAWFRSPTVVPVEVETAPAHVPPRPDRSASFFSGGVDSFFTLLDHGTGDGRSERGPIDELLYVEGFDARIEQDRVLASARRNAEEIAAATGRPLRVLRTNVRSTRWKEADWARLSHGSLLTALAHLVGRRYARIFIPSSQSYRAHLPWGSDPYVERVLGPPGTLLRHDGMGYRRWDKVPLLAPHALFRSRVRVCWESDQGTNCGTCEKCLSTMLLLDLAGVLGDSPAFGGRSLDLRRMRAYRMASPADFGTILHSRDLARKQGRRDLARALDEALARSSAWVGWVPVLAAFRRRSWLHLLYRPVRRLLRTGRVPGPPPAWDRLEDAQSWHACRGWGGPPGVEQGSDQTPPRT